jgi:dTDP-4-dehydrorhamnose reductase
MAQQSIVLTGAAGQLGKTLQAMWPESQLADTYQLHPLTRSQLDITSPGVIGDVFSDLKPTVVINCSAYTAVDNAERDVANAFLVNEQGPENLAKACAKNAARLIHVSTDFVFSGEFDEPIAVNTPSIPAGVYGVSKRAGENAILKALPERSTIFRTSWLYSPHNANFVKTMLRLMAEKESLGVVADQRGAPTSTMSLSAVLMRAVSDSNVNGVYHWSDGGDISWYDFAVEIQAQALELNLLNSAIPIKPIKTSDYPTAATRPAYSVLDCTKTENDLSVKQSDWKDELGKVLREIKQQEVVLG